MTAQTTNVLPYEYEIEVFRTLPNIYSSAFFQKYLATKKC